MKIKTALVKTESLIASVLLALAMVAGPGCAKKSEVSPIYESEALQVKPVTKVQLWSEIPERTIKPIALEKFLSFRFIKLENIPTRFLRDIFRNFLLLLSIPMDLTEELMPYLPTRSEIPLPVQPDWNDPKSFEKFKAVRVLEVYFKQLSPTTTDCVSELNCRNVGFNFLKNIEMKMKFSDLRGDDAGECGVSSTIHHMANDEAAEDAGDSSVVVTVALADRARDFNRRTNRLTLHTTKTNLRDCLLNYKNYRVLIEAKGKSPPEPITISGGFLLEFEIPFAEAAGNSGT